MGTYIQDYAFLFDMDGTLAPTLDAMKPVSQKLARDRGFEITDEDFEAVMGMGAFRGINYLLEKKGVKVGPISYFTAWTYAIRHRFDGVGEFEGIHETLGELRDASEGKMAIQSNSPLLYVWDVARKFDLLQYFKYIITPEIAWKVKPHSRFVSLPARLLGVRREKSVVFGDTPKDVDTANAADALSVALEHYLDRSKFNGSTPTRFVERIGLVTPAMLEEMVREREFYRKEYK